MSARSSRTAEDGNLFIFIFITPFMKYGLLMLGIILLLFGTYLSYIPTPVPKSVEGAEPGLAYHLQAILPKWIGTAAMVAGAIIIVVSLFLQSRVVKIPNAPYDPFRSRIGSNGRKKAKGS
jgi:hypothetical protein